MKTLLILLGLVAMATADCGGLARLKVKQQWNRAFGEGTEREAFGTALWNVVFHKAPKARELFKRVKGDNVYSPEFQAHSQRVLGGLDMSISLLDDSATLNAQLAHLNMQHKERAIDAAYFAGFKEALLEVVPATLGRCFDQDAWSACFDVISGGINA